MWPYRETRRKVIRSWSSQLQLMNTTSTSWKFLASQSVVSVLQLHIIQFINYLTLKSYQMSKFIVVFKLYYSNSLFITQHWEWLQEDAPEIFAACVQRVKENCFIPIGGSYVEFGYFIRLILIYDVTFDLMYRCQYSFWRVDDTSVSLWE